MTHSTNINCSIRWIWSRDSCPAPTRSDQEDTLTFFLYFCFLKIFIFLLFPFSCLQLTNKYYHTNRKCALLTTLHDQKAKQKRRTWNRIPPCITFMYNVRFSLKNSKRGLEYWPPLRVEILAPIRWNSWTRPVFGLLDWRTGSSLACSWEVQTSQQQDKGNLDFHLPRINLNEPPLTNQLSLPYKPIF